MVAQQEVGIGCCQNTPVMSTFSLEFAAMGDSLITKSSSDQAPDASSSQSSILSSRQSSISSWFTACDQQMKVTPLRSGQSPVVTSLIKAGTIALACTRHECSSDEQGSFHDQGLGGGVPWEGPQPEVTGHWTDHSPAFQYSWSAALLDTAAHT